MSCGLPTLFLSEKGVATLTALAFVAAGGLGVPLAADSANPAPDSDFYGLEKAGESIKGVYKSPVDHQTQLIEDRTGEYEKMVQKGKGGQYLDLIDKAQKHIDKAESQASNSEEMKKVRNSVEKHLQVLTQVRERVPDNALQGIDEAISNAERVQSRLKTAEEKTPGDSIV